MGGAQAPGAKPVDAYQENRLIVGELAEIPPRAAAAAKLAIQFNELRYSDYAITLRRGKISTIQEVIGGTVIPSLDLADGSLHLLDKNNQLSPELGAISLKPRQEIPDVLADAGRRFILRHFQQSAEQFAEAQLSAGIVQTLSVNGETRGALTLTGKDIISLRADGKELKNWHRWVLMRRARPAATDFTRRANFLTRWPCGNRGERHYWRFLWTY